MATNKDGKEEWVPQNRETEGTWMEAIERKAMTAKKKVHLKTQHGRQEENGWERENKMEIAEKKLLTAETDGQFDLGRKRKKDKKASTDRHMRPAAQLNGGCVCTVENVGRKK